MKKYSDEELAALGAAQSLAAACECEEEYLEELDENGPHAGLCASLNLGAVEDDDVKTSANDVIKANTNDDVKINAKDDVKIHDRYGECQIKAFDVKKDLELWPNTSQEPYLVQITLPEFACLCPRSGYPDFATLYLEYMPNELIVELKALKLYINSFYYQHISHEAVINEIYGVLKDALKPSFISLKGVFNPRGNVHTTIECRSDLKRFEERPEARSYEDRGFKKDFDGKRSFTDRKDFKDRPFKKDFKGKPFGDKKDFKDRPFKKDFDGKKPFGKSFDKGFSKDSGKDSGKDFKSFAKPTGKRFVGEKGFKKR